jgi:hypothetical protein
MVRRHQPTDDGAGEDQAGGDNGTVNSRQCDFLKSQKRQIGFARSPKCGTFLATDPAVARRIPRRSSRTRSMYPSSFLT